MTSSAAEIQAEQASAALSVTIDSGPQVNMGELKTEGLERVPEKLVQRYVRYSVGSSYEQSRLDQWQQDLQSTAFSVVPSCRCSSPADRPRPNRSPTAPARGGGRRLASAPAGDPSVSAASRPRRPTIPMARSRCPCRCGWWRRRQAPVGVHGRGR